MTTLYNANVYDRTRPVGSFWETTVAPASLTDYSPLSADQTCDVAIIGGGITGLSAALHLGRDRQLQVRVLEAGVPAWGASGDPGTCTRAKVNSERALSTSLPARVPLIGVS